MSGRFLLEKIECATEPKWSAAFIGGAVLDAAGNKLINMPTPIHLTQPTGGWMQKEGTFELPEGAAVLDIGPGLYHFSGDFSVDDLVYHVLPPK